MRLSICSISATAGKSRVQVNLFHILFCLVTIVVLTAATAAQTAITPTTSTIQLAGTPDAQSPITAPDGGIVMYGTAISPVTGQRVRHLWVADATAGICRIDPDLDLPGPYAINRNTCTFAVHGSRVVGGSMAFDSTANLLYFVDNQKTSQGVFRIRYLPGGDSGNGALDFASTFSMGGNSTSTTFGGGQTRCALPGNPTFPNSAALDPEGNLWVGFKKSAEIIRFNHPGTATAANFGACDQFIQVAATIPNNRPSSGLAWIGHDLWLTNGESQFVIRNADTVCLSAPNPACSAANGTMAPALAAVTVATSMAGDQFYPATNGNNLYFGQTSNVAWVGNVAGGAAGQTLTLTYIDPAQASASNVGAVVVDGTDPANLGLYSGDDPSALGTAGAGRWFWTMQTAAAPGPPGAPLHVVAGIANGLAMVSWSPAQAAQPVNSYTVHNSFASDGQPLADVAITPAAGAAFPATSATISGIADGVSYRFQVLASNDQGSSPLSTPSNLAPVIPIPDPPTGAQAVAGDAQAAVSWTPPASNGGLPITSYTVTALVNGVSSGITATVPAPAASAVVSGLSNGVSYTFTVHAANAAANSPESAPSNAVTPLITNVPVMRILVSGPVSVNAVPTLVTYKVAVTNTSLFPITNVVVSNFLTTTDGAFIILAQPDHGICTQGGPGVTTVVCALGDIAPGASSNTDVVVQMQLAQITLTSRVTAFDTNGSSLTFKEEHRSTSPPGNSPPPDAAVISVPISASATPTSLNPGQSGTLTWTAQNTTGVTANNVLLTLNIDSLLTITGVTATPGAGSNPFTCGPPVPGLVNTNLVICSINTLGGPKSANPVTTIKVTVNVTAPNLPNLQLLPSGTVSFDGIDSSNPTATVVIRVH